MARTNQLSPELGDHLPLDFDDALYGFPSWADGGSVYDLVAMKRPLIAVLRRSLAAVLVGSAALLCWGLGIMSIKIEGYIWFDPYIDTWFAPGYRPDLEKHIRVGMTRREVQVTIGEPLSTTLPNRFQPGLFGANYTNDGGHDRRLDIQHRDRRHKDFAWHYFTVMYDSTDVVRDIYSGWGYD